MICTTYFLTFFSELIPPTGSPYILLYDFYIRIRHYIKQYNKDRIYED